MHIVHVTPHLPPDQGANALLPWQLGAWAVEAGDSVEYLAHPPRLPRDEAKRPRLRASDHAERITWIRRRRKGFFDRTLRLGSLAGAVRVWRAMEPALQRADLVHVHSNGLLPELAVLLARRAAKPVVLTLYGTEIWHYRQRRMSVDLFTRAYRAASAVTFYSARLLGRARELGLTRRELHVVYPPVALAFGWHDEEAQRRARAELHIGNRHLLLNVKRLHPLAGQRYAIEAMTDVVRTHPDTRLVICGSGELRSELEAVARSAAVERHVSFTGAIDNATVALYCAAADLFLLPSVLEALPTVVVEALACGTPTLSSDNPGGLELNDIFGADVAIVPARQPIPFGAAITHFLNEKRRAFASTRDAIERLFRPAAVAAQYREIYERARADAARLPGG
jgi:glycosyltransferase involved in cell wall biosynthesis